MKAKQAKVAFLFTHIFSNTVHRLFSNSLLYFQFACFMWTESEMSKQAHTRVCFAILLIFAAWFALQFKHTDQECKNKQYFYLHTFRWLFLKFLYFSQWLDTHMKHVDIFYWRLSSKTNWNWCANKQQLFTRVKYVAGDFNDHSMGKPFHQQTELFRLFNMFNFTRWYNHPLGVLIFLIGLSLTTFA